MHETKAAWILIECTQGVHTDVNRMNNRGVDGVVHAFSHKVHAVLCMQLQGTI